MQLWESTTIIKAQEALKQWRSKPKERKNLLNVEQKNKQNWISENTEKQKTIHLDTVITLDHLTNPDKK